MKKKLWYIYREVSGWKPWVCIIEDTFRYVAIWSDDHALAPNGHNVEC